MSIYTKKMTQELIDLHEKGMPIEELAEHFKVPKRSIITKLSILGLHKKQPYKTKTGNPPVYKKDLIDKIMIHMGLSELQADSLDKCSKRFLVCLADFLDKCNK